MAGFELIVGPYNTSSHSLAAWLALHACGLEFATVRLDTADPAVAARINDWSPSGRLPVLLCDGAAIAWELWAIFELAGERLPQLWPADPLERARARALVAEASALFAFQTYLPMDFVGRFAPPAILLRPVEREAARLRAIWTECRQRTGDRGLFLFGDFGLVDAVMVPLAARFRTYGLPLSALEKHYVDTVLSLDAVLFWEQQARAEREGAETPQPAWLSKGAEPAERAAAPAPTVALPSGIVAAEVDSGFAAAIEEAHPSRPAAREPPPAAAVPSEAEQSAAEPVFSNRPPTHRLPLFVGEQGVRRTPEPERNDGFGPLPLAPTTLPSAARSETWRMLTPAAEPNKRAPAAPIKAESGPQPHPPRAPLVKPIGRAANRRR